MIVANAISSRKLVKRYGRTRALDGFSLDVPAGAVLGLVGPNGAGKTTWMMALVGLLRLESGEIDLLGKGPFDAAVHGGAVAILPQDSELPLEMTPRTVLVGFAKMQGLSGEAARKAADEALAAVNLADRARSSIRSLSHGMRKRVMVAQCFLGEPALVLLDEPMNGLDPDEAERMRRLILAGKGRRTVVISSHNLLDLERLCTHVAFVEAGRVVRVATVDELMAENGSLEASYLNRSMETRR